METTRTIKTRVVVEGGDMYRAEVAAICTDLNYLRAQIEGVYKSVTQLNEALKELDELRKAET